jgi:hypothetical protein
MANAELLKGLRLKILAEMEKRARQRGLDLGKDMRSILYSKLDAMKERRQQLGNPYGTPTRAERSDLIAYLTERAKAGTKS